MKFKIDENLPIEFAELLQNEGYGASTIYSENLKGAKDPTVIAVCQQEQRVLITLDLDFAGYSDLSTATIRRNYCFEGEQTR